MTDSTPKRGRPFGAGEGRAVTFRLRLTPEERVELDRLAEEQGQTPSQFIRTRVFGPSQGAEKCTTCE